MKTLAVLDPRAAFVDVGSEHMHVSVAGDEPTVFGTVTSNGGRDLTQLPAHTHYGVLQITGRSAPI